MKLVIKIKGKKLKTNEVEKLLKKFYLGDSIPTLPALTELLGLSCDTFRALYKNPVGAKKGQISSIVYDALLYCHKDILERLYQRSNNALVFILKNDFGYVEESSKNVDKKVHVDIKSYKKK